MLFATLLFATSFATFIQGVSMKKALINIDYTNDFVASDGSLTVGEPAQKLEKRITQISKEFSDSGEFVVFAIDTHHLNDPYHPGTKLSHLITSLERTVKSYMVRLVIFMRRIKIKVTCIIFIKLAILRLMALICSLNCVNVILKSCIW